jgi:hypothetical protein
MYFPPLWYTILRITVRLPLQWATMDQTNKTSRRNFIRVVFLVALILVGTVGMVGEAAGSVKRLQTSQIWSVYLPLVLVDLNLAQAPNPSADPARSLTPTATSTPTQTPSPTFTPSQTPTMNATQWASQFPEQVHITDGVIIFALIIIAIIHFGMAIGLGRKIRHKPKPGRE